MFNNQIPTIKWPLVILATSGSTNLALRKEISTCQWMKSKDSLAQNANLSVSSCTKLTKTWSSEAKLLRTWLATGLILSALVVACLHRAAGKSNSLFSNICIYTMFGAHYAKTWCLRRGSLSNSVNSLFKTHNHYILTQVNCKPSSEISLRLLLRYQMTN